jgi:hypothetical protein
MKINPEHYKVIKNAFTNAGIDAQAIVDYRGYLAGPMNDRPAKDPEMRLRWDLFHKATPSFWICDVLYPYLNDSHIDSALRSIVAEIEAKA